MAARRCPGGVSGYLEIADKASRRQGFYPLKLVPCIWSRSKSGSHRTSVSRNGYLRLLDGRLPGLISIAYSAGLGISVCIGR